MAYAAIEFFSVLGGYYFSSSMEKCRGNPAIPAAKWDRLILFCASAFGRHWTNAEPL